MFKVQGSKGITLVELMVTIGILVVLFSLATIAFNDYQINYNVEGEIKTLYSDLQGARMRAMNENRPYIFKFTSSESYVAAQDTNGDGDWGEGDVKVDKYSKDNLKYDIVWNLPGNTDRLTFDNRGMININGSVHINRSNSAKYNCIAISNTRIKMGEWKGTNCETQ